MASPTGAAPPQNSRPERNDQVAVIRTVPLPGAERASRALPVLLVAWIVSAVVHAGLLGLFLFVTVNVSPANVATETEVINAQVDEEKPKEANLENDDPGGLDPDQLLNFNLTRVEDTSVPGPVNPTEDVGIKDLSEALPANVPPPPGLGGNQGQSGGVDDKKFGLASPVGYQGGMQGLLIPGGIGGRSGSTREQLLREGGGNEETEAAVAMGQKWIVQHQAVDGHWSLDGFNQHGHCNCSGFGINNDIAATAFGLLPLLGAGETHKNPKAAYRNNVERALKYLMLKQGRDGDFGGGMYAHGLAAIAICEAYGMTSDPLLKGSAQRAINFIRSAQSESGGWRYEPRQGGDTSVLGWQVMALKSGQMAGLEVDDRRVPTLAKATKYLNSVMTADGSGYGYQSPDPTPTMTAVGLLCRLYLGTGPRNSGVVLGVNRLRRTPPPAGLSSMYYYYYATQVMHHVGGDAWEFWNPKMRQMLLARQDKGTTPKHPHQRGSWAPAGDAHAGSGGRLMITSLSVLTLEVYYRHLPLYRRDLGAAAKRPCRTEDRGWKIAQNVLLILDLRSSILNPLSPSSRAIRSKSANSD
jgi:hypothetical protein